jgi:DNA-binding CsgD family transcriptional regulator
MSTTISRETSRGLDAMQQANYPALTLNEALVFQLYLQGMTTPEIARCMGCSTHSVTDGSGYLGRIRRKFQVDNNVSLVKAAIWFGFTEPELPRVLKDQPPSPIEIGMDLARRFQLTMSTGGWLRDSTGKVVAKGYRRLAEQEKAA